MSDVATDDFHERSRQARAGTSSDRTFGLVVGSVLLGTGLMPLLRHRPVNGWLVAAGGLLLVAAMFVPRLLGPANSLWTRLGRVLHRVTNPVLLGLIYYLAVVPVGLVMRALGKDLLRLRSEPAAESYWIERNPPGPAPETMKNQF
jgi:saxitoxin biosynthesis operon SxtJ-like protein